MFTSPNPLTFLFCDLPSVLGSEVCFPEGVGTALSGSRLIDRTAIFTVENTIIPIILEDEFVFVFLHVLIGEGLDTQSKMFCRKSYVFQAGVDKATAQLATGTAARAFEFYALRIEGQFFRFPGQARTDPLPSHHPQRWIDP